MGQALCMQASFLDITEQKKTGLMLRDQIAQRDKLAEQVPGVLYQYRLRPDGTSHFPYASQGIKDIYGVSPDQVLEDASAVFEMLHPDDLERVTESIMTSARTLSIWHDEYRVIKPEGKIIWVEGESTPEALEDGSVLWHGYIQDITDRRKISEELQQSADIINNMQIGLFVYELEDLSDDRSLRLVAYNKSSVQLSGAELSGKIGLYIDEIFPQLRKLGIPKRFADVVRTGIGGEYEDIYYKEDQSLDAAYSVKAFALPNNCVGVTFDNITNSKLAELELKKANEIVEESIAIVSAIIEGTSDSIWAFDINFNVLYINHAFQRFYHEAFGFWLQKGSNLLDCIPDSLQRIWRPRYQRVIANEHFTVVDKLETAQGKFFVLASFNPIIKNGIVIGGSCFACNITGRFKAEEALRDSEMRYRTLFEPNPHPM